GVIGFRDIGYVETTAGTQYFLVMDYAEGEPLSVVLDRKHILSEQEARDLAGALLRTFLLLEREGISHLDIKPENIIIPKTSDGKDDFKNAKLIDFGNALRTDGESREGVTIATPSYAPPETWPRGEASLQRDLYSLGMVLYHGVEGIIPHEITPDQDMFEEPAYEHPSAILERRKKEEAPPLVRKDVSEELRGVIAWMVKKEVDERPASAEAVLNRLGVPEEVTVAREAERVKAAAAAKEEAVGPAVALEVEEKAASSAAVMEEEVAEEITTEEFEELKTAGLDGEVNWLRPRVLRAADGRDPEIVYYPAMRFDIYRALNITNAEKIVGVDPLAGVSRRDIINNFIRELERLGVKIRPLDIKIKGVSLVDINGKTTRRIRYEVAFDYKDKVRSIIIYQADANQFTPDTLPETEKGYDMHYTYGWSPKASALERSLTGLNEGGVMMFHIMPQDIEERINYDELAARDDFGEADEALWRGRDIFGNEYEHRIVLFAKTGVEKEAPLPVSVEEEIVREGMPVVTPIREAPRPGRGGIDLGPMEIETRGEGLEISLESLPFDLKTFEGFTFQILKLERVDDVGRLLGHVDKEEKEVSSLPAP
ncbi:MAG: protein kinase, partial [Candidatus Omnitrophota bacterium]